MDSYGKFKYHHMDGYDTRDHSCMYCGQQWKTKPEDKGKPTVYCIYCKGENINFVSYKHQKD